MADRLPGLSGQNKAIVIERWLRCGYVSACQVVRYWWHG